MRKILYAVTCIVCLITFIGLSDAQTISVPEIEGEAGSAVETSIGIGTDVENVGSIDVTLVYDAELLTAQEVITVVEGFTALPNLNTPGEVVIGAFSSDGQAKTIAAGDIFIVNFEVNADAQGGTKSDLILEEMVLSDVKGKAIPTEVKNGAVTIIGALNAISIPQIEGEPGTTVEMPITINTDVENVGSIDVTLVYDAELLTAQEVVTVVEGFTALPNLNTPGEVVIGAFSSDGQGKTIAAGDIFIVNFEVNADAQGGTKSDLILEEMVLSDVEGNEIATEVINGEVTVTGVPNIPPIADAGVTEISAQVGEEIQFDGSTSTDEDGTIESYNWDFGDGEVAEGDKVVHAYAAAGEYTVTLTVTDDKGDTGTTEIKVTVTEVENKPPVAAIAGDAEITAQTEETIEFDGSGSTDEDGTIESYDWDFGDGESGEGEKVTHAYAEVGEYTVTLTVTDDKDATGTATVTVTVGLPPEPAIREHEEGSPMLAFEGQFPKENISAKGYIDIWTGEFEIEAGQYLEYQIAMYSGNPSFNAGIDLHTTDGALLSATDAKDEPAGLSASPNTDLSVPIKEGEQDIKHAARDRWYHRKISLDALADKTLDRIILATESEMNRVGKMRIYVDNIQITDGENRLLDVYIDDETILDGKQEVTEGEFEGIENASVLVGITSVGVQPAGKLPLTWGKIKAAR